MGWSDCGTDSQGRPIGYAHPATCDHPGCSEQIDRGLSYACGGMHGEDEVSCERYFCSAHRLNTVLCSGRYHSVCDQCAAELAAEPDWVDDESEGVLRHVLEHQRIG
ncbi:hypothetical protein QO259_17235 [Salinicola sp. JS01]|uniref:hypothetical protein n=1 Tax=Salinicola sp. JS01 TaxID=3050071 RepID=UPI00255C18BC|nr:hypothetical protein [Salinicola sp. JS01]WIX32532.1 hypothetical protein QO259_17235 [Salinicola sp. JS01]